MVRGPQCSRFRTGTMTIVKIWELSCQLSDSFLFAKLELTNIILDLTGVSAPGLSWELSLEVGAVCSVRIWIVLSFLELWSNSALLESEKLLVSF